MFSPPQTTIDQSTSDIALCARDDYQPEAFGSGSNDIEHDFLFSL